MREWTVKIKLGSWYLILQVTTTVNESCLEKQLCRVHGDVNICVHGIYIPNPQYLFLCSEIEKFRQENLNFSVFSIEL